MLSAALFSHGMTSVWGISVVNPLSSDQHLVSKNKTSPTFATYQKSILCLQPICKSSQNLSPQGEVAHYTMDIYFMFR